LRWRTISQKIKPPAIARTANPPTTPPTIAPIGVLLPPPPPPPPEPVFVGLGLVVGEVDGFVVVSPSFPPVFVGDVVGEVVIAPAVVERKTKVPVFPTLPHQM